MMGAQGLEFGRCEREAEREGLSQSAGAARHSETKNNKILRWEDQWVLVAGEGRHEAARIGPTPWRRGPTPWLRPALGRARGQGWEGRALFARAFVRFAALSVSRGSVLGALLPPQKRHRRTPAALRVGHAPFCFALEGSGRCGALHSSHGGAATHSK